MKFNKTNQINSNVTSNKAGGKAYKINDIREKLALQVLTSFVSEDKYYGDNTKEILATIDECMRTFEGMKFVRNLGLFARKEFNLRSISHVIGAKLAESTLTNQFAKNYINDVCIRPDDMLEIVSIHRNDNNNKVAACVKKGVAEAFHKFDAYQLSKYKGNKKALKLKDLINISHPKPRNEAESALYKSILEDTIETPMTWEVEISKIKKTDTEAVRAAWEKMIFSKNEKGMYVLGIMALIRNLNNILKAEVNDNAIKLICDRLRDPKTIHNSKQFPFRFFSAYRMVEGVNNSKARQVLNALETSIELSVANMPKFEGRTCVIADESGSMSTTISKMGSVTARDIANLFAAIMVKMSTDTVVIPFGEHAKKMFLSPNDSIFTNMKKLENSGVGYATYLDRAFKLIMDEKFDRIVVFSDFQTYKSNDGWNSAYTNDSSLKNCNYEGYVARNGKTKYHSLDLVGYGTSIADPRNPDVNLYGGFSEKSLTLMQLAEAGVTNLVQEIENYVKY